MNRNIASYVSYFRNLAAMHYQILHDPQQEESNSIVKATRKFVIFDNDEVATGLRSQIGSGIVLFLEVYTFQGKDNEAGDYRANHQARFIIARKVKPQSWTDLLVAYNTTEKIVWDFVNKIIVDSNFTGPSCGTPFKNLTLNNFSAEPVSNLWDGRAGWVVDFTYQQDRTEEIDEDKANDEEIWGPYVTSVMPSPQPMPTDWNEPLSD